MKIKKNKLKNIPQFKNEDEERKFWDKHSVLDFPHIFKPVKLDFSKLMPSTQKVTLRLPLAIVEDLKMLANMHDVPYQSLMKIYLAQRIDQEYYRKSSAK